MISLNERINNKYILYYFDTTVVSWFNNSLHSARIMLQNETLYLFVWSLTAQKRRRRTVCENRTEICFKCKTHETLDRLTTIIFWFRPWWKVDVDWWLHILPYKVASSLRLWPALQAPVLVPLLIPDALKTYHWYSQSLFGSYNWYSQSLKSQLINTMYT